VGITEPDPFDYEQDEPPDDPWAQARAEAEHGHMQPSPSAAVDEREAMRRVALTVHCRDCNMQIGVPCVHVGTDQPLRKFPAHTIRLNDARKAQR
jgi:hypothetical protein